MSDSDDQITSLLKQAQSLFRDRQYAQAVVAFQTVLEHEHNNLKAVRGLAASYSQSGQIDKGIEQYQLLTTIDLSNGNAWLNLGTLLISQERYQEAVKALRTGLMKEKKSAIGYYHLGRAQMGLNQASMATTAFKEAIKLDPEMINAHIALGRYYLDMKSHGQAIKHFEDALKVNPNSERAANALREARQEKHDSQIAANPFGRLVDMDNMGLKSNVFMSRELSTEEKLHDRQMVRSLATDLMLETTKCLNKIREDVEPALLSVSRKMAEGGVSPNSVLTSVNSLQEALQSLDKQRKLMRQKVMFMRGHEEVVNTPEFGGHLGMSSDVLPRPKILDDKVDGDE